MSSYILCKILSFQTQINQKVFNRSIKFKFIAKLIVYSKVNHAPLTQIKQVDNMCIKTKALD